MKRSGGVVIGFILSGFPCHGESLAGYYLQFLRPVGMWEALSSLVYVFCGMGSLFSMVLVYQKMQEGEPQAGKRARQWCLSLMLIGVCTLVVSLLGEGFRSTDTLNLEAVLTGTTQHLSSSFPLLSRLVYVSCGIIGLLVLPQKFYALQQGDRRAGQSLTSWGLALIGTVAMVYLIHKIFFP